MASFCRGRPGKKKTLLLLLLPHSAFSIKVPVSPPDDLEEVVDLAGGDRFERRRWVKADCEVRGLTPSARGFLSSDL